MKTGIQIRPESPTDYECVRQIHRKAFGQDAESRLVDALREGGYVRLSLVAERDLAIVGHILFSDICIITSDSVVSTLALAPLAVHPEHQNQGIGSALVRRGMDDCRAQGHRSMIVVGHPQYYTRFGFSRALTAGLESPYAGESFMAAELIPGALHGVRGRVEYSLPFSQL